MHREPWRGCCGLREDPSLRENWIDLASDYDAARDRPGCYFACQKALAIRERPRHYMSFGYAWGKPADDLAAVSAWYMGMKEKAAEHMRRGAGRESGRYAAPGQRELHPSRKGGRNRVQAATHATV